MSTCFDLTFFPHGYSVHGYNYSVRGYSAQSEPVSRFCVDGNLVIRPGDRLLVPTGLFMKIANRADLRNYPIRLHASSGMALKKGLVLANAEGVIDADYQQEIFVMLANISSVKQMIQSGERICQAEIVQNQPVYFKLVDSVVGNSERADGFDSTGH